MLAMIRRTNVTLRGVHVLRAGEVRTRKHRDCDRCCRPICPGENCHITATLRVADGVRSVEVVATCCHSRNK